MAADPIDLLTRQARAAGYTVETLAGDTGSVVRGIAGPWRFVATRTPQGWRVILDRPGWPRQTMTVTDLRAILKAQTPIDLGKAR